MHVPYLNYNSLEFPDYSLADASGLLAISNDITLERVLKGYQEGVFPWYCYPPVRWYSPDPRMVLFTKDFHYSKSFRKTLKKNLFKIRYDSLFHKVIEHCASSRKDENTWINADVINIYNKLHSMGYAHSVEAWIHDKSIGDKLVGGLYGVLINGIFFGESMFHFVSESSKYTLYYLVQKLKELEVDIIDCQVHTKHLASFGAKEISRSRYLIELKSALQKKQNLAKWY